MPTTASDPSTITTASAHESAGADATSSHPAHAHPTPQPRAPIGSRVGLGIVALLALTIAAYSLYLYAGRSLEALTADGEGLGSTYVDTPQLIQIVLYVHIGAGSLALVLGPLQFIAALRRRAPVVHRVVGRVYAGAVAIAAAGALVILPFNTAAIVGFFGFGTLAVLWFVTMVRAVAAARRGDIPTHRAWMMRNYALTFAAPMLRLWTGTLVLVQVALAGDAPVDGDALFMTAYVAVPFLCWIPNLVVAEWLIRRRGLPSYRLAVA